jgi:hypothetical protein
VALALLNFKSKQFGGDANGYLIPSVPGTPGVTVNPNTCAPTLNTGPLILSEVGRFTDDQFTANWDRSFHAGKDRVAVRFFYSNSDTFEPFGADSLQIQTGGQPTANDLNFPLDTPLHGRFGSITETHLFASNLVNEFRFGLNVISDSFINVHATGADAIPTATQLGINQASGTPDAYRFQFGAYAIGPYPTTTQSALSDNFTWLDTLSWTHGPHTFRFGGEIDRITLRRNLPILDNGLLYFEPGSDFAVSDFQNFLLGSPLFAEAGGGAGNHDYRIPSLSFFAQDDYRVTQTLTVNLGVRSELLGAPYDDLCHIGNVNPALVSTGQPYVYPSCVKKFKLPGFTGTLDQAALNNEYATVWEPRIGLAYDLFGHHTTSIRAGYGMYSVREDLGAVDNLAITPPVFPVAVPFLPGTDSLPCLLYTNQSCSQPALIPPLGVVSGSYVPVPSLLQGFANNNTGLPTNDTTQTPVFSGNVSSFIGLYVPLHWIAPTTQQWNLTVQHEFGMGWFLELGYVGTKGTHLRVTYDPDEGRLVSPSNPITVTAQNGQKFAITQNTASNAPARAQYLPLSPAAFEAFSPISDSHYNALQLTVAHHFSGGLYLQSAYTYSNSIDDVSTASVAFLTRFNDQNNPSDSTGLSDFNRRHRSITSYVYELPFFKSNKGFVGKALGGWETSGVLTLQGGSPFTLMDSAGGTAVDLASPAITASFAPNYGCSNAPTTGSISSRLSHWVNPAAYQPAPVVGPDGSTGYGDSARNCIIGPPQKNMDFTIGKTFRLTERQDLRFRVDFFNFTNHPSFANPAAVDVESPSSFAQIAQTIGTPRLVQFSLKYSF